MNIEELTGTGNPWIDREALGAPVHRDLVDSFRRLQSEAASAGFELRIASGFRDFDRQLAIWNAKAEGRRPLFDTSGRELDRRALDDWQCARAILRWSALPGASRHHWGSDLDVYDAAAVAPDYTVRLDDAEAADSGPFGPLHRWLDTRIEAGQSHGFFRPYARDRGGIAPERWHLSFAPLACRFQASLNGDRLFQWLAGRGDILLWDVVAAHWDEVFERYIDLPAECYPEQFRRQLVTP